MVHFYEYPVLFWRGHDCKRKWTWLWLVAGLREVATESTKSLSKCVYELDCLLVFVDAHILQPPCEKLGTYLLKIHRLAAHFCFRIKSPRLLGDVLIALHSFTHVQKITVDTYKGVNKAIEKLTGIKNMSSTLRKHGTTEPIGTVYKWWLNGPSIHVKLDVQKWHKRRHSDAEMGNKTLKVMRCCNLITFSESWVK